MESWHQASSALQSEDFEGALTALENAIARAQDSGNDELVRRLHGGRLAVRMALGEKVSVSEARELLGAAQTLATTTVVAYQLGRIFELRHEHKKALFYARMALTAAESAARPRWLAVAHNLVGNVLIAQSFFDEAIQHYETALASDHCTPLEHAQACDNLAFALTAIGELDRARPYFAEALGVLRFTEGPARLSVELDLALFHLQSNRAAQSIRYADAALKRSNQLQDPRNRANALLLLTECAKATRNDFLLRRCLSELTDIYDGEFAAALSTFDVLELVNLKA